VAFIVRIAPLERYVPRIRFRPDEAGFLQNYRRLQTPYEPGEVPSEAIFESSGKTIADFVPINGHLTLCPEIRDLIESVESGRHQFMPVHIRRLRSQRPIFRLDGRVLDEPYYLFQAMTFLDSVWVEKSDVRISEMTNLLIPKPGFPDIVLHKEVTAGHHVWRESRIPAPPLLFSDALMATIDARRYKKLDAQHVKEE
jgi:hypothetical protein